MRSNSTIAIFHIINNIQSINTEKRNSNRHNVHLRVLVLYVILVLVSISITIFKSKNTKIQKSKNMYQIRFYEEFWIFGFWTFGFLIFNFWDLSLSLSSSFNTNAASKNEPTSDHQKSRFRTGLYSVLKRSACHGGGYIEEKNTHIYMYLPFLALLPPVHTQPIAHPPLFYRVLIKLLLGSM